MTAVFVAQRSSVANLLDIRDPVCVWGGGGRGEGVIKKPKLVIGTSDKF